MPNKTNGELTKGLGARAVAQVLASFSEGMRTEPTLYGTDGNPLLRHKKRPPKILQDRDFLSLMRKTEDQLAGERKRVIKKCARTRKYEIYRYSSVPPVAEIFAPVLRGEKTIAVLASGPLLVEDPPDLSRLKRPPRHPKNLDRIPKALLDRRVSLVQESARCVEAVARMATQWESAEEAIQAISAAEESKEIFNAVLHHVMPLLNADACSIMLLAEKGEVLDMAAHKGYELDRGFWLGKGKGICWRAVEKRRTVYVPDVHQDPDYVEACDKTCSELVAPLLHRGHVLGVLDVEAYRPNAFGKEERVVFEALASIVATALVRRDLLRDMELVEEVARALASTKDLNATLRTAVHEITKATKARCCYLFLREPGEQEVRLRAASKEFEDLVGTLHYRPGEGFTGTVLQTKKEAVLSDPKKGMRHWKGKYLKQWKEQTDNEPVRALLAAPLVCGENATGVICLTNRVEKARSFYFSKHDREILRTLCDLIAPAIADAREITRFRRLDEKQETGLCIIKKPDNWEQVRGKPIRDLRNLCMTILYANHVQHRDFSIAERESICYKTYNPRWRCDRPCPWCPVLKVFAGSSRAEDVTHSPTRPHAITRHYKVIATRYVDDFTGEEAALESIMDITESIELQDLLGRLVLAPNTDNVYQAVAEAVARTFQALRGIVVSKEAEGWSVTRRFHYSKKAECELDKEIIRSLYEHPGDNPLMAYLEERQKRPSSYIFIEPKKRGIFTETEIERWIRRAAGKVRFKYPNEIPAKIRKFFPKGKKSRLMVLPVPIQDPTGLIVLGESGKSRFFPDRSRKQEACAARASALAVCDQAARGAQIALERIQQEQDFHKASDFLDSLIRDLPEKGLDAALKIHVPRLLGAKNFTLFSLDPTDNQLHIVTTTGLLHDDGTYYSTEELRDVAYRVSPDDGLTGWVAHYGESLNVPRGFFRPSKMRRLFGEMCEQFRNKNRFDIKIPPRWKGKHSENPRKEHCYLAMPIFSSKGNVIGVCRVTGKTPALAEDFFSESDVKLLRACCLILGLVMELKREVQESERNVAQSVGHHLKNMLPPLLDRIDYVINDNPNLPADSRRHLEFTRSGIELARNTVMKFFRFATGKRAVTMSEVVPDSFVEEIAQSISRLGAPYGVTVKQAIQSIQDSICVDREVMSEVYEELLDNAVRHSGRAKGKLVVTLGCNLVDAGKRREKHVCLFTEDNGSGIDKKTIESLLQPLPIWASEKLGLILAQNLVRQMGGRFRVTRAREGGARIEMHFSTKGAQNCHGENGH